MEFQHNPLTPLFLPLENPHSGISVGKYFSGRFLIGSRIHPYRMGCFKIKINRHSIKTVDYSRAERRT